MTTTFVSTLPVHIGARPLMREPRVEPADSGAAWDAYVGAHPLATMYHLYAWKTVAETVYNMRAPFLVVRDTEDGPIRGVLPLVRVPRPFAPYLTTGLFGSYGPLLADDARYGRALLAEAKRRVQDGEARFLHLKIIGELPAHSGLEHRSVWVTALLDVAEGPDALWHRLKPPMRTKIRQAERAGLLVELGRENLDAFYAVLSENMLRKGSPIYGHAFMRVLSEALGDRGDIVVVKHEGKVISGALVAWFNGTMLVPFVSSLPSSFRLRPNNFLYWKLAARAHELGLHTLDFGTSMRGSSGFQFKESWKPRTVPVASYVFAAHGKAPDLAPVDSPLTKHVVRLWSGLPPRVAEALGPVLCRWIA